MIGTDEVEQLRLRESPSVVAHGVDAEGRATALELLFVDLVMRLTCERKAEHSQAFIRWSWSALGLKWRLRSRDEEQARHGQLFTSRLSDQQMPAVNGIERSAVEAETLRRIRHVQGEPAISSSDSRP